MKKLEIYDGTKTYMYPNMTLATPQIMLASYPAILKFKHVIETDEAGEVCFAIENLSAMRSRYGIDSTLTEEESVQAIQDIINTPEEVSTEPTTEERTATALEEIASGTTSESTEVMNILLTGEEETTNV